MIAVLPEHVARDASYDTFKCIFYRHVISAPKHDEVWYNMFLFYRIKYEQPSRDSYLLILPCTKKNGEGHAVKSS